MYDAQTILNLPKLGMDDTLTFSCTRCGRCCRDRDDVLLTPLDLFKIANHLNMKIGEVMEQFCDCYEGQNSKIPVVRIKPKSYQQTCPFLKKGICQIHSVKPTICALFPLGRMTNFETDEFMYFVQPAKCGKAGRERTIRDWLDEFSLLEEEHITILWHKKLAEVSLALHEVYEKIDFNHGRINGFLLSTLYIMYDLEQEFLPQFERNLEKTSSIVKKIAMLGEEWSNGELGEQ
jgi:hypothetical protein